MRYLIKILNYVERISFSDLTHMMIMIDLIAIGVESLKVNSRCYVEKELYELIYMNA